MIFWEIFRFEVVFQLRRTSTKLYFIVFLGLAAGVMATFLGNARSGNFFFNAPIVIAGITTISSLIGVLITAAVAGNAATRDAQTRMEPLLYTAPISKASYLGGRFLGAFAVNALLLAAVPLSLVLTTRLPGLETALVGPFRPAAYLGSYVYFALPNAFVATALLFALGALSRRVLASYFGGAILFVAFLVGSYVAEGMGHWALGKLLDPLGFTGLRELSQAWTPLQKSTRLLGLDSFLLANRLLWLSLALGALTFTYYRFRLAHLTPGSQTRHQVPGVASAAARAWSPPASVPRVPRAFGLATRTRQTLTIAARSYRTIVTSRGALVLPVMAVLLLLVGPELLEGELGTPSLPTTGRVAVLYEHVAVGLIVALLITLYTGQLVWQERDARLSDITDVVPVPNGVILLGKFLGIALLLISLQALLLGAGVLLQFQLGYDRFEFGLYLHILYGFQLVDYLLLAMAAMAVHVLVNQPYVAHLIVLLLSLYRIFAGQLGVEHHLLVYASDPGWAYSDLSGFVPFIEPWLWFKLYWGAWALLFGVIAGLFWVQGKPDNFRQRIGLARRRLTRAPAIVAGGASGLILTVGTFIFYNTNVLNDYHPAFKRAQLHADYERRYGQYQGIPQPVMTGTKLHVELHPAGRAAEVRGRYQLVNRSAVAIDSVHLVTNPDVHTTDVRFDRPARVALTDTNLGYRIYVLQPALQPGDSLHVRFHVRAQPRGFTNHSNSTTVVANGTYFEHLGDESPDGRRWLPMVGYQPSRELNSPGSRRLHGLAPRAPVRSLHDVAARREPAGRERIAFEAVVGTDANQVAVAPGTLRRTWTARGRHYYHYVADAPIRNWYALFSAGYAVREVQWQQVRIQVFYHPGHPENVERMLRSARASLAYYSRHFGPYPYGQLKLVEHPGAATGLRAYPGMIAYSEGFAALNPRQDERQLDLPFAVIAHEVAHQWWANQLVPAEVEGAPLLTESLAWYSALLVVEDAYGPRHLRRLLQMMRREYLTPRSSAGVPLLRAANHFDAYRKGPFAMHALRAYLGAARVNGALRRLLLKYGSGQPPFPTSLDLYTELEAIVSDSSRTMLYDLFEKNTFWQLKAENVRAAPTGKGPWHLTLDVRAQKVAIDSVGTVSEIPMDDLIEVGVFSGAEPEIAGQLYLRKHRIRSGHQTITVTVPREPASAGIDPQHLLLDREMDDNVGAVVRHKKLR